MSSEVVGKVNACSSKVEFKWEIDNFCMMGCKNVGDCLLSPNFPAYSFSGKIPCEIEWILKLYPKGLTDDDKDYLSLYLFAFSEQKKKFKASGILKILDNEGKVIKQRNLEERIFDSDFGNVGFSRFSLRNFIMRSGILSNDEMTIACEITMPADEEDEMKLNIEEQEEIHFQQEDDIQSRLEVIDKFEALLNNNNKFSDVSLISDGKVVKAHKCILANSSPVFAAMFDAEMNKESQENTFEIADVKYDVLVEMIRFVYTGKAKNIDELAGELVLAADKYDLDVLKNTCVKKMLKSMNIDNVVDRLQIADKLCIEELREEAIQFIVEEGMSDVTEKPEFRLLSRDIVCEVCCALSRKYEYFN